MANRLFEKFQRCMVAAAFAEEGDHRSAFDVLGLKAPRRVLRKRARQERRVELRAPRFDD